jgi:coenzyme A diphosphatase NUDT7
MDKKKLIQQLSKIQEREPAILGRFAKFSVFIPLVEVNGETHVLFEVRSKQMRRQPGEICFPGGRKDEDDFTEKDTAVRETCEELGIERTDVNVIVSLDYLVAPFGRIIYPFAGWISDIQKIKPNKDEVHEIFTVPLTFFEKNEPTVHHVDFDVTPDKNFPLHLIPGGENYKWRIRKMEELFFIYNNRVIWGLTARILKHFIDLLKEKN